MIKYTKETDILIPQHISKIGVYTGHSFLLVGIYCIYDNYTSLAYMLFGLYVTTILHWSKIYRKSVIKNVDIAMSVSVLTKITIDDSFRWGDNRKYWIYYLCCSVMIFLINNYCFHRLLDHPKIKMNNDALSQCYYCNVMIHTVTLHICPSVMNIVLATIVYF